MINNESILNDAQDAQGRLVIPEGVIGIENFAFADNCSLTSVVIDAPVFIRRRCQMVGRT